MSRLLAAFVGGLIFAFGLGISGMTDANKVIGFLNLAGDWDPSLAFVMVGAIGVHLLLYRAILRRESPLFAQRFQLPTRRDVDSKLVVGSALFGVGWGLGGICPGPALVSLMTFGSSAGLFVLSMFGGMLTYKLMSAPKDEARCHQGATC